MTGLKIAPEAVEGVRTAQVALQEEATRLTAVGDPIAPAVSVLARAGDATNRLLVDVFLKTQATIEEGRKPWSRDEMRMLINQIDTTLLHRWAQFNRAAVAICAAVAVVFGAACFGGGYWFRASAEISPGVTGCQFAPQPQGGEAWNCTFWTRMPTPGRH